MTDLAPPPAPSFPRRLGSALMTSPALGAALIGLAFLAIGAKSIMVPTLGAGGAFEDFDAFYIAGMLAQEGRLAEAYDMQRMADVQRGILGIDMPMPWTYPPPYNLLTATLAWLPRGPAYLVFMAVTLSAYLWALHRLVGAPLAALLVLLLPTLASNIASGQNGFLIGALVGAVVLAALNRRQGALAHALPLGLMVIKPHLGLALGVWALAGGRWRLLAGATLVALGLCALSTAVFGPAIWGSFRQSVADSSVLLSGGGYQAFRMVSVHAVLLSAGAPDWAALAMQAVVALVMLGATAVAARRAPPRLALALACAALPTISPYAYDYDLAAAGVGLALVLPDLIARARLAECCLFTVLVWLASGWWMLGNPGAGGLTMEGRVLLQAAAQPAISGLALLAAIGIAALILRRPSHA